MKPKHRVGDRVKVHLSNKEGVISQVQHRPAKKVPVVYHYKEIGLQTRMQDQPESYAYRINGQRVHPLRWYPEDFLTSLQPCPNCEFPGWNWITPCNRCACSAEDGE